MTQHYTYILWNDLNEKTYNGYTTHPSRRLRQHNGEIKGGAKFTTRQSSKWEYLAIITSADFSLRSALSFEWHVKYPTNRRPRPRTYQGAKGRLQSLPLVFSNPKFAEMTFQVHVHPDFMQEAQTLLASCTNVENITLFFDHII